jgi:limonene-1,2-epoxide hydrolase
MTNADRARAFIKAWEDRDLAAILDAVSEDCVYHNIPMAPLTGKEQIKTFCAPFLAMTSKIAWDVIAIAESAEGKVLTERLDRFEFPNGKALAIPVMGTMEFDAAGKITAWRDYFDLADFQKQMAGAQS